MQYYKGQLPSLANARANAASLQNAGRLRVVGGRGSSGFGSSIVISTARPPENEVTYQGYQGNWPESAGPLIGAFQFVGVEFTNETPTVGEPVIPQLIRYRRVNWTGSGQTVGITLAAATGKYELIPVKLRGLAPLWIEEGIQLKEGERVGSATGQGDGIWDQLGPVTLIRELEFSDYLDAREGFELWLVHIHGNRGDMLGVSCEDNPITLFHTAHTILWAHDLFVLTSSGPGVVTVTNRP